MVAQASANAALAIAREVLQDAQGEAASEAKLPRLGGGQQGTNMRMPHICICRTNAGSHPCICRHHADAALVQVPQPCKCCKHANAAHIIMQLDEKRFDTSTLWCHHHYHLTTQQRRQHHAPQRVAHQVRNTLWHIAQNSFRGGLVRSICMSAVVFPNPISICAAHK